MRCALCGRENEPGSDTCASCQAKLDAALHEELSKIDFLLDELKTWEQEGRISLRIAFKLASRYQARKKEIIRTLTAHLPKITKPEAVKLEPAVTAPPEKKVPAKEEVQLVAPPERKPPSRVEPAPAAPVQPRDFKYYAKRLFSDRNIRVLQQIGIFVFIAGVIAFVYSQWTTWPASGKILSMAFLTSGFFVGGSLLRKKTSLRWTAISVTMLGSLFIPISCFVGIRHNIFTGEPSFYWAVACLISIGTNGFLAKALSEEVFAYFVWIALYGLVGSVVKRFGVSYGGLLPYLSGLSVALLLLRPYVVYAQQKVKDLEVSYSRPLEVLINVFAAALFVLLFVFMLPESDSVMRAHFARHFITIAFLTFLYMYAGWARGWSFYLLPACVLKCTAFGVWARAFEPSDRLAVPLLMTLGVSFHIVHLVLKKQKGRWFALSHLIFGKILRGVALFWAVALFAYRGKTERLDILLWTLGQFAVLCAGIAIYTPTLKDAVWMLSSITVWLFALLAYLEVASHNFPAYFLLLATGAYIFSRTFRGTRFKPLVAPFVAFTHAIGISAVIGIAAAFQHYLQSQIGHGLANVAVATSFAFCVGIAAKRFEWLTLVFVLLSGLLTLILHNAGVVFYHIPYYLCVLASAAVLLTIGAVVWRLREIRSLQPVKNLRPQLGELRKLLSLPALVGSVLVSGIALIVLLVAYRNYFDRQLHICTIWDDCLLGVCLLGAYCVIAALSTRLVYFEYAALISATAAYSLLLQSYRVGIGLFASCAVLFCVAVTFVGLLFSFLRKKFMSSSALQYGLLISVVAVLAMLVTTQSYQKENLLSPALVLTMAAALFCYFSLRRQEVFEVIPDQFTYIWSAFAVAAYAFFFMWTDVQLLRDLYTVVPAAALLAYAALLPRKRFEKVRRAAVHISYASAVAPFVFMLAQALKYGQLSPDTHLTLIVALSAVCAYHVAAAAILKREWLEYVAISAGYLAWVSLLLRNSISVPRFGFVALPVVFTVFLTGQVFTRLRKSLFARSAFLCGLILLAVSVVVPMCSRDSYENENLPFVYSTLLIAAGITCYFALRRFLLFEKAKTSFSYCFAVLLCVGHALFLEWLSTGTPLAGLYFLQVSVLLVIVGWILKRFGFERQWRQPCLVSFAATGVAMYLAISRSDLTAVLVFIACCVLYSVLHLLMRYRFFLWAATISFSTAYFFALSHLKVEPLHYLLWFSVLAAAQVAFSVSLGKAKTLVVTPVLVIGMLTSFSVMIVMLALRQEYFKEHIDMAIVSTLIAAATYFLCARRLRNIFFYYLSSVTALGAYYLLLHKYKVTMVEPFTIPVAGLIFAATAIHALRGIKTATANWGYALGSAVLLVPAIVRSFWIAHLDSCIIAYALSFGCVVAAMMFRRKVVFGAGIIGIVFETVVKLVHFIIQRHLSRAEVIMIVGGLIFAFAVTLELVRNRRLREKAGLTKRRLNEFFSGWS